MRAPPLDSAKRDTKELRRRALRYFADEDARFLKRSVKENPREPQ
jgi:hypothetical protein